MSEGVPEQIKDLCEPYGEAYQILIDMVGCDEIGCPPSGGDYAEHRNRIIKLIVESYFRGYKASITANAESQKSQVAEEYQ